MNRKRRIFIVDLFDLIYEKYGNMDRKTLKRKQPQSQYFDGALGNGIHQNIATVAVRLSIPFPRVVISTYASAWTAVQNPFSNWSSI